MRRRGWVAWMALLLGLALLTGGNVARSHAFDLLGGALAAVGLGLFVSLFPFWAKAFPPLPPMPDLLVAPKPGSRWCARCGRPAPQSGPCVSCGGESRKQRRAKRRLHRKQRARSQERKT